MSGEEKIEITGSGKLKIYDSDSNNDLCDKEDFVFRYNLAISKWHRDKLQEATMLTSIKERHKYAIFYDDIASRLYIELDENGNFVEKDISYGHN